MADIEIAKPTPPPGEELCDFCGTQDVHSVFLVRDGFDYGGFSSPNFRAAFTSIGPGWGACPVCADFIASGDRDALAEHSTQRHLGRFDVKLLVGPVEEHLRTIIRAAHDNFWSHREAADPIPVEQFRREHGS